MRSRSGAGWGVQRKAKSDLMYSFSVQSAHCPEQAKPGQYFM
jgi:hypothetical protein